MAKLTLERPHYGQDTVVILEMDEQELRWLADLIRGDRSGLAYRPQWTDDILRLVQR